MVKNNRTEQQAPDTLNQWMEHTGTNLTMLRARLSRIGRDVTLGHLSNVVKRSRRCSLGLAVDLNEITGVPIRKLAEWPPESPREASVRSGRTSGASAADRA
jgi:hypothetical protein